MSDSIRTLLERVEELDEKATDAGALALHHAYYPGEEIDRDSGEWEVSVMNARTVIKAAIPSIQPLARALEAVLEVCDNWLARGHHMISAANDMPEDVQDGVRDGGYDFMYRAADIRNAISKHLGGET